MVAWSGHKWKYTDQTWIDVLGHYFCHHWNQQWNMTNYWISTGKSTCSYEVLKYLYDKNVDWCTYQLWFDGFIYLV